MTAQALHFNPFAHLVSPDQVLDAIRQSEALESLRSEVFRPLDRPFLRCFDKLVDVDAEIDAMPDEVFEDETPEVVTSTVLWNDDFQESAKPLLWDDQIQRVSQPVRWG
jgi:hypothetical protein